MVPGCPVKEIRKKIKAKKSLAKDAKKKSSLLTSSSTDIFTTNDFYSLFKLVKLGSEDPGSPLFLLLNCEPQLIKILFRHINSLPSKHFRNQSWFRLRTPEGEYWYTLHDRLLSTEDPTKASKFIYKKNSGQFKAQEGWGTIKAENGRYLRHSCMLMHTDDLCEPAYDFAYKWESTNDIQPGSFRLHNPYLHEAGPVIVGINPYGEVTILESKSAMKEHERRIWIPEYPMALDPVPKPKAPPETTPWTAKKEIQNNSWIRIRSAQGEYWQVYNNKLWATTNKEDAAEFLYEKGRSPYLPQEGWATLQHREGEAYVRHAMHVMWTHELGTPELDFAWEFRWDKKEGAYQIANPFQGLHYVGVHKNEVLIVSPQSPDKKTWIVEYRDPR